MANRSSIITQALVLLIISNIMILAYSPISNDDPSSSTSSWIQVNTTETGNSDRALFHRGSMISDDNVHGGYWLDTFEDRDGSVFGENLNLSSGEVKLELDHENIVFSDDLSTNPLDDNKWNEQIGSGTQFTPSPVLLVLKSEESQTKDAYIETDASWPLGRIVEWEWKSVLEGGSESYDHYLHVFHTPAESIRVTIGGDRRVMLETTSGRGRSTGTCNDNGGGDRDGNDGRTASGPVFTISENTWYKMCCKISSSDVEFTIKDMSGKLLNTQTIQHQMSGTGRIKLVFALKNDNIASFDVRLDNLQMSLGYQGPASLTTVPIELTDKKSWDMLAINKLEPFGTSIRVSILDGHSDEPIAGYSDLDSGIVNISGIEPNIHSSLRLKATLEQSTEMTTPVLNSWGLSWVADKVWQDTFISASKISGSNNVIVNDGAVQLANGRAYGTIITKPISVPAYHSWNTVFVDKIEPNNTAISITIIDKFTNDNIDDSFTDLSASVFNINSIDPITHPVVKLKATFTGNGSTTPILDSLIINWSVNTPPEILELNTQESVLRTNTVQMSVKCVDSLDQGSELQIEFNYRSPDVPDENDWQDIYFSDKRYYNDHWIINFTPESDAVLGKYAINISCTDRHGSSVSAFYEEHIEVVNNKPGQPTVRIVPGSPNSTDDLKCLISNVTDIEEEPIEYNYEWYKNSELQAIFTDQVPSSMTERGDIWKCIVTPNDGNDPGEPGNALVKIQNSEPIVDQMIKQIIFYEDTIDNTSIDLSSIFADPDNDALKYSFTKNVNISIKLDSQLGLVKFTPEPDWSGNETIFFRANDSMAEVEYSLLVNILPVNDPPVINSIYNRTMIFRENLTIVTRVNKDMFIDIDATDVDSDKLKYSIKIDGRSPEDIKNLDLDGNTGQIWFRPNEDDLGSVRIMVIVRDNDSGVARKEVTIKVIDTTEPELWLEIQSLIIMVIMITFIVIIISIFIFMEWRRKKKQRESEGSGTQDLQNMEHLQKTISPLEMLKLLAWHRSKNDLDLKTYKRLRKRILAMDGAPISVSKMKLKIASSDEVKSELNIFPMEQPRSPMVSTAMNKEELLKLPPADKVR